MDLVHLQVEPLFPIRIGTVLLLTAVNFSQLFLLRLKLAIIE